MKPQPFTERIKSEPALLYCMAQVVRMLLGKIEPAPWVGRPEESTEEDPVLLKLPPPLVEDIRRVADRLVRACGGAAPRIVIDHALDPDDWVVESPLGRVEVRGGVLPMPVAAVAEQRA